MSRRYAALASKAAIPQTQPLNKAQVKNNAGGYVYALDDWKRLERFLVLGSDAATYYQNARTLTRENAEVVERCWTADAMRTVGTICNVSVENRAPKNDPAVFALAMGAAHASPDARKAALAALPMVCRTSTHLFQFVGAVTSLGRGWGRGLKRAVADWYERKSADSLAWQMIKYREREGYSHKRLLQTAHPSAKDNASIIALYRWARGLDAEGACGDLPPLVLAHLAAMKTEKPAEVAKLITAYKLPWEAVPTAALSSPDVWRALIPHMGLTALIRNLGRLTANGTLKPLGKDVEAVADRIRNAEEIKRSRVHPMAILLALTTYRSGRGFKGSLSWTPVPQIVDALDDAFLLAFQNVVPTGKRIMLALDVSGSMMIPIGGTNLSCREASAAMAMVTARTEKNYMFTAFCHSMVPLAINAKMSLDSVTREISGLPFGGTDCALPMLYACENKLEVDTFAVFTDNETHSGRTHPEAALGMYRSKFNRDAKLIVVGMTATGFTIANPSDRGMLDVVGFDAAAPAVMADFIRD